jgi:hypothetical protein
MDQRPTAAFVLTLLAGLGMLGSGAMMYHYRGILDGPASWMWGHGMMRGMMGIAQPGVSFLWLGSAAGLILLIGSTSLYIKPTSSPTWGLVIVSVALLNLFVGMGSFLAAVLGIIGGALAISWKAHRT